MQAHTTNRRITDGHQKNRLVTGALGVSFSLALLPACAGSDADDPGRSDNAVAAPCPAGSPTSQIQCPAPAELPPPAALIDDLEDADGLITTTNGRSGGWWTARDDTVAGTITPAATGLAAPEPIVGARCGSKLAMRVTGQGFLDWGALLGVDLVYGKRADQTEGNLPYDASAYSGVEFWARIGDTSTDRVRFAVSDVNSEPYGGICSVDMTSKDQCYDTFGTYLNRLEPTWRHYRVPFASLTQRNFGHLAPAAAVAALFSVQFNFEPGAVFDLWVDDLAFY